MLPVWLLVVKCKEYSKTHLKIHTGEKSNKCHQCDFTTIQTGNLKRQLKIHTGEKLNKCNQCDYECSQTLTLMTHLKAHTLEKSPTNVTNVTLYQIMHAVWGHIWWHIVGRQSNATNATMHIPKRAIWGHIWKHVLEKSQINAISVTMRPLMQVLCGNI